MKNHMYFIWFTNQHGVIGIAKTVNSLNEVDYYISSVSGLDEEVDKETVITWGSRFPNDAGDVLFQQAKTLVMKRTKNETSFWSHT